MAELEQLIAHRRALGLDGFDEVWEGEYHVAPHAHSDHGIISRALGVALDPFAQRAGLLGLDAFNLGDPRDYRVPDGGFVRGRPGTLYVPTAAVVVEVVSPDDETFAKLPFYVAHGVEEVLVALPEQQQVRCFDLTSGEPVLTAASAVLGITMQDLTAAIAWPGSTD